MKRKLEVLVAAAAAQNADKLYTPWNTGFLNALCYMKLVKTYLGIKTYQ